MRRSSILQRVNKNCLLNFVNCEEDILKLQNKQPINKKDMVTSLGKGVKNVKQNRAENFE